ncbi:MAG TPA: radical SAM protein, partial [bacterium]|nr:radical SAM protein [bacterium]
PSMAEYQQLNRMSHRTALLDAGRGCPYKCVYCSENILWNYKARMRSVPKLIEELRWLKDEHGVDKFLAAYDLFTAKRSFVIEFCESLLDSGLDLGWHCICRLDGVDDKLLQLMSRAGCDSLCYGADSGSAETLKFIKKSIREDLVFPNILATKKAKIVPTLSFVIGFPEETPAELDKTLDLALRSGMLGDNNPLLQMVTVLAGTPLLKDYEDRLVKGFETYFSAGLGFNPDGSRLTEDQALIDGDPYTFSSFYNIDPLYLELDTLHCLQRNFPLLVFLFSKSLYILNKELNPPAEGEDPRRGYLALFLEYMEYLEESGRGQWEYGIQQALEYFPEFMHHKLDSRTLRYPYAWEVLDYELATAGLERVPKPLKEIERTVTALEESGTLDGAVVGWSPEVTIGRYTWPLDTIFEQMKLTGVLPDTQPRPTTMVFSMRYYELSSQVVSDPVAEVLELAHAEPRSVGELIALMQARYPQVDEAQVAAGVREVAGVMLRRGVLALVEEPPVFEAAREITPGLRFV